MKSFRFCTLPLPKEKQTLSSLKPLHDELLLIAQSSTLSVRQKLKQLHQKALENPEAGYLVLLDSTFWKPIVAIEKLYAREHIQTIAQTSYEAGCLFFKTKELVNYVLMHPYGGEFIKDIAEAFPETAECFFEQEDLIKYVLALSYGEEHIIDIAEKAPTAFLTKQNLVDRIREHADGEKWIKEMETLAAENDEKSWIFVDSISTLGVS